MADSVLRAFEEDDIILVEAGTGTGKTLAYLIPALLSGKKTIVSTGTKNLQEQIFFKDIPFIRKYFGSGFSASYLKGRENYLCLNRYKLFIREPAFALPHEVVFLDTLKKWAKSTQTGDKAELKDLPDDFAAWADLSASSDKCLGSKCPDHDQCFIQKARRTAAASDLVVVNHHLFMSDLAVRDSGHGEVIPRYEAVIFDEAHELEDVATQYFGKSFSTRQVSELVKDAVTVLAIQKISRADLRKALVLLEDQSRRMSGIYRGREGEFELWTEEKKMNALHDTGQKILTSLDSLNVLLEDESKTSEDVEVLVQRGSAISKSLAYILEADQSSHVYWAQQKTTTLFLSASPIEIGPELRERLFSQGRTMVFTSATLTARQSFDYIKKRLGIFEEAEGYIFDSPFDFENQSLLYVPDDLPAPASKAYLGRLLEEVCELLKLSRGRAFVLFTSYRNLNYIAEHLPEKLDWPCLVQGSAPRGELLDRFRSQVDSVLLATQSFWQGVDVPGESLSAVIIDKLPFAPPERPLIKARLEKFRLDGQDPFFTYQVPAAIISLKQGLGRLIRTETDHGLMAVLDSRLLKRNYGRMFFKSLPPSPLTNKTEDVAAFFDESV